ncbi:MAG: dihydrofolate reductase [Hyphomicrobiaceae bacterium]
MLNSERAALEGFKVTLVVAATRNSVIGRSGDMPWHMPSSLKRFRALTMGRPMIMGRKTYQAIGKPLDGRDTIVITRDRTFSVPGVHVARNLAQAFELARRLAVARGTDEIIIAGGGEIYRLALPYATDVHLDRIDTDLEGDTTLPLLDPTEWQEAARYPIEPHPRDDYSALAIHFLRIGAPRALESA